MADDTGVDTRSLMSFIERIERVEEETKSLADDKKDIYAEAKASGLEPKYMKVIIKLRKQDPQERASEEEMLDVYKRAVGL